MENEAPIVGAISVGFMSQMYRLMRLLLPTPNENQNEKINTNFCSSIVCLFELKEYRKKRKENRAIVIRCAFGQGLFIDVAYQIT